MQPVVNAVGLLLLTGNLLVAVPVGFDAVLSVKKEQTYSDIHQVIVSRLASKGVESASADDIVREMFDGRENEMTQMLTHVKLIFPEIRMEALLDFLAERALYRTAFSPHQYEDMVAMVQSLKSIRLEEDDFRRIRQCVSLNRAGGSTDRTRVSQG